ncbi:NADPH-dependent oxidoreductase [Actinomyces polynesiensis]|uniref:NADPH-dependent oxidoreductase n=1 Tax=Actinomyces polynesiensis TaxID=1325934 RepID=UPI0009E53DF0|nr:NADPH-dependent oxidoreductase [Actinomyces polynesiensis]
MDAQQQSDRGPGRVAPTTFAENETIRTQLAHRTIRAFTPDPVGEEVVRSLLDVARHAPTSSFYQQTTVLWVRDPVLRHEVYRSSGQPYVDGTRGELLVFVVDLHRNACIREEAGEDLEPLGRTTLFLEGVEDAVIAAQNTVVAAESLGLGTVYLGSIGGDPRRVIRALRLPRHTFPLLGLLVGHPDQEPQFKPRLPADLTTAVDTYPEVEDWGAALAGYDATVQTYYDLRDANRRVDSFTHQIRTKPGTGRAEQAPVLEVLHEQGLALG